MVLELIFWVCIFGVGYAYLGYPLLLAAIGRGGDRRDAGGEGPRQWPSLTVLVAARNEARRLAAKLDDVLAQDYPADRLQVIVVSDGSTDDTAAIASGYAARGVECIELRDKVGKETAQARGITAARGEVLVFTDVATRIGGAGLRGMAAAFQSASVGAVSSEDRFVTADGRPAGEGLYVRYEMWLRQLESRARGLVGLSGSLFAVRRELCDEWPADVPSDFVVALRCARRGLKAERGGVKSSAPGDAEKLGTDAKVVERRRRRAPERARAGVGRLAHDASAVH